MTEFYKLHKKKIIVISFLFLLFFGGYWNLRYNLPKTIEFITGIVLGAKIKSSDIVFEKNKILVKDFALEDKKDTIISAPEVEILYSKESLKKFRVEEIIVDGGQATIVREKNGDINVECTEIFYNFLKNIPDLLLAHRLLQPVLKTLPR